MKLPCEVVQDLLPLYHDGVCSAESSACVKEHLDGCEKCRELLTGIAAEIKVPELEVEKAKPLVSIQVSWNRQKRKQLLKCLGAGVLAFVLFVGCWWGLTQWCIVPLKGSDFTVLNQCVLPDGCIFVEYTWDYGNCALNVTGKNLDGGIEYQTRLRPVLGRKDEEVGYPYVPKNGLYFFPEEQKMLDSEGNLIPVEKIYLGTEGDGVLLWERGTDLPAADLRIEENYRDLLDAYDAPNAPVQHAVISVIQGIVDEYEVQSHENVQETVVPDTDE